MDIDSWLAAAIADAQRRGLPELEPLLKSLAEMTRTLRAAEFDQVPDERAVHAPPPDPPHD